MTTGGKRTVKKVYARVMEVLAGPKFFNHSANGTGAPVTPDYEPPFRDTGTLISATVDVSGDLIEDD